MLLVLSDKGKGMQSSSEQPLVGEEHCVVTTLITAAKETTLKLDLTNFIITMNAPFSVVCNIVLSRPQISKDEFQGSEDRYSHKVKK